MNTLNNNPIELAKTALEDSNELLRTITDEGVEQSLAQIHDNLNVIDLLSAAQEERGPVAWMYSKDGHVTSSLVREQNLHHGYIESPLYLTPPSSDQVWNEAVEAVLQALDAISDDGTNSYECRHWAAYFFGIIRSLKRPLQAQELSPAAKDICNQCESPFSCMKTCHCERTGGKLQKLLRDEPEPSASGAVDNQPSPVTDEQHLSQQKALAFDEWLQKTDWVQAQILSFQPNALGKHRADVMREEIERLRSELSRAQAAPDEVQAAEAKLYRDLTSDAMAMGYDGIPAALEALRAQAAQQAKTSLEKLQIDTLYAEAKRYKEAYESLKAAQQAQAANFERIEDAFPGGATTEPDGSIKVSAQWLHDFARALLSQSAAPVSDQPAAKSDCNNPGGCDCAMESGGASQSCMFYQGEPPLKTLNEQPAAQTAGVPEKQEGWMKYFKAERLKNDGFDGYRLTVHGSEYSTYTNEFEYLLKAMLAAAPQPVAGQADEPTPKIGPVEVIERRMTCNGCPALQTKYWSEVVDDERDSGTSADCAAAGGKSITAYWSKNDAPPSWCPHIAAAHPQAAQAKGGSDV